MKMMESLSHPPQDNNKYHNYIQEINQETIKKEQLQKKIEEKMENRYSKEINKNNINNMTYDIDINNLLIEKKLKPGNTPKWGEVCFRIKLNENEYRELMKEKSKQVKI